MTEEFHPGVRNSTASYTVSLLSPRVIAEMELARHGLRVVERRMSNLLSLPDGRYLAAGEGRTNAEVAKFSAATRTGWTPMRRGWIAWRRSCAN